MKMVSMKIKAETGGKSDGCCCSEACACDPDKPRYPWGLQIHLEKEQLELLGITELPKVGTVMTMQCIVKVTGCSESEQEDGEPRRSISLQITDMGTEQGMDMKKTAETLYGDKKEA